MYRTNFEWLITTIGYDLHWRKVRGAFHRCLSAPAILPYRQVQKDEVKRYLLQLLEDRTGSFAELGRKLVLPISAPSLYFPP